MSAKTMTGFAPVKASSFAKTANMLDLHPTGLKIPRKNPLEIFGEPQAGKTLYSLYLTKKFQEQLNTDKPALVIRCEKFDSETVAIASERFEIDPDVVDLFPDSAPKRLLEWFGVKHVYEVDDKTGRIDVAVLDDNPVESLRKSIFARYSVVMIDTLTSVLNTITSAGLKNFPARNMYENIVLTFIELLQAFTGVFFISTHEHSKNITQPYSTIEVKGGKEIERRCDYILRLTSGGSGENRVFNVYTKRWSLVYPENTYICSMVLRDKDFIRLERRREVNE
ncbi:MAG: hypothetical protein QXG52_06070 [Candidatus Caldarchaeum sp.]